MMMDAMLDLLFSPATLQRIAGSLLHFFWQGALIAMAAAVAIRLLARRSAESRYMASVLAMFLMLLAPIATFIFYNETGALSQQVLRLVSDSIIQIQPAEAPAAGVQGISPASLTQWIVLLWFCGVLACSGRLLLAWYTSRGLILSSSADVPEFLQVVLEEVRHLLAFEKRVVLRMSATIDTPAVVGWLKPVVLLPVSAITGLNEVQLCAILAHELAHIRRHDFFVNTLQRCIEALLFYHPAVWWLSARIRAERENCCDDLAVTVSRDRLAYAKALLELERVRIEEPALHVAAAGGGLTSRIHRILGGETSGQEWQSAVAALLFAIAWLLAGAWQSPTIQAAAILPPPPPIPAAFTQGVQSTTQSIVSIITAKPQAGGATTGTIQGVVTRDGSSDPIPHAAVTVVGRKTNPAALQDLLKYFEGRGVTLSPPANGDGDARFVQGVVDAAATRGVSTVDPEVQSALMRYSFATSERFSAISDSAGRFKIDNLPAGQYSINGSRADYFDGKDRTTIVAPGRASDVAVSMVTGGVISGRIVYENRSVANAEVYAYSTTYQNGYPILRPVTQDTTDDRGEFRLFWLPPGEYFIAAIPKAIAGAKPGTAALLTRPNKPGRTFYPGSADSRAAKRIRVKQGDQVQAIEIAMKPAAASHRISGVVTSTVGTMATLSLVAHQTDVPDDPVVYGSRNIGTIQFAASRDQNAPLAATFDIDGIASGDYQLIAATRESNPDGGSGYAFGDAHIEVRDGNLSNIQVNISPTKRVTGSVLIDGHAPVNMQVKVSLQADGPTVKVPVYQGIGARAVVVNEQDGSFMIPAVATGHFRVAIANLPPNVYVSDARQGGRSVFDSGIDITGDAPAPLQILLSENAATVQGAVQDVRRQPIPGAMVVLAPLEQRRSNRALYKTAVADSDGNYVIRGVAPGDYKIFAWEKLSNDGSWFNSHFLSAVEEQGRIIHTTQGGNLTTAVTAIPADGR
jgi:beta-lactamase regulating signal transducer with metallopeptidase domain